MLKLFWHISAANAVTSISSAVDKFESDDTKTIISGAMDVGMAISEFLPPPYNAVMGPVSAIFNGVFGIGKPTSDTKHKRAKFHTNNNNHM